MCFGYGLSSPHRRAQEKAGRRTGAYDAAVSYECCGGGVYSHSSCYRTVSSQYRRIFSAPVLIALTLLTRVPPLLSHLFHGLVFDKQFEHETFMASIMKMGVNSGKVASLHLLGRALCYPPHCPAALVFIPPSISFNIHSVRQSVHLPRSAGESARGSCLRRHGRTNARKHHGRSIVKDVSKFEPVLVVPLPVPGQGGAPCRPLHYRIAPKFLQGPAAAAGCPSLSTRLVR